MRKIKCLWAMCFIVFFCVTGKAQVIKIENGFAIANLKLKNIKFNDRSFLPYQMSVGLDYMDKGWFMLSSNVGYLRKGCSMKGVDIDPNVKVKMKFDYLTANTTFRVKTPSLENVTAYAGVGPRLDVFLKGSAQVEDLRDEKLHGIRNFQIGLKTEVGLNYDIQRIQLGLNFSYLPTFNSVFERGEVKDRTFTFGLSVGYIL